LPTKESETELNISCIALAGGKSSRLGRNKLTEVIGDKILLHRVLDTLSLLGSEIIIVTPRQSSLPEIADYSGVRIIRDIYPDKGSLGGIYTGLAASKSPHNLVVASDMPFLNVDLLRYMLGIASGADLVAYRDGDRFEPLHAVYSRNCVAALEQLVQRNNVRIIEILRLVKTRFLTLEEIARFDPGHLSFFNVNTEEELSRALDIVKTLQGRGIIL
jgi:molybdenum cofactor guanylyltransferase